MYEMGSAASSPIAVTERYICGSPFTFGISVDPAEPASSISYGRSKHSRDGVRPLAEGEKLVIGIRRLYLCFLRRGMPRQLCELVTRRVHNIIHTTNKHVVLLTKSDVDVAEMLWERKMRIYRSEYMLNHVLAPHPIGVVDTFLPSVGALSVLDAAMDAANKKMIEYKETIAKQREELANDIQGFIKVKAFYL